MSFRPAPIRRHFGRRMVPLQATAMAAPAPQSSLGDDLRLFAMTFAGGFLFMAVYLA